MKQTLLHIARLLSCVVALGVSVWPVASSGLDASEIVILVNRNSADSVKLGEYYAEKRGVPRAQILQLDLPSTEDLSRSRYTDYVVPTIRKFLAEHQLQSRVRCLLTTFGVPLRVGGRQQTDEMRRAAADCEEVLASELACLQEAKRRLDLMPQQLLPVPAPASMDNALPLSKRVKVEDFLRQLRDSFHAAQLRIRKLENAAERERAEGILFEYDQLMGGRRADPSTPETAVKREEYDALMRLIAVERATRDDLRRWAALGRELHGAVYVCLFLSARCNDLAGLQTAAAFDSELSLLWWDKYALYRWQANPLRPEFDAREQPRQPAPRVLMVSRLDGPTPAIARRLVDDAIAVEAHGLRGTVYLDARGMKAADPEAETYAGFDELLRQTAAFLRDKTKLRVVLDDKPELFKEGECPDAALYCGWYSLGKYVPAFRWVPGAVGYHVASGEAVTLRQRNSQVWCRRMLEEGVCATLGSVAEPYIGAFPRPTEFFPLLLTGKWTLAECYYRVVPCHSWMMILIGDPLYRPYAKNPVLAVEDLPPSLAIPSDWGK